MVVIMVVIVRVVIVVTDNCTHVGILENSETGKFGTGLFVAATTSAGCTILACLV